MSTTTSTRTVPTADERTVALIAGMAAAATPETAAGILDGMRRALDAAVRPAPPLPALVPGADGEELLCQHVFTEEDAEAGGKFTSDWIVAHMSSTGEVPTWSPAIPVVGEVCGEHLTARRATTEYRTVWAWDKHGSAVVGESQFGDSDSDSSIVCTDGHEWAVPDLEPSALY